MEYPERELFFEAVAPRRKATRPSVRIDVCIVFMSEQICKDIVVQRLSLTMKMCCSSSASDADE